MESLKLKDLDLSVEESRDIIEFLTRKRGINNYKQKSNDKLLNAIKKSEKKKKITKIISVNKKRIGIIGEELKELSYKLLKDELKEIKKNLYKIESKRSSLG